MGVLNHILMKVGLIAKPLQWLSITGMDQPHRRDYLKAFPFACVNTAHTGDTTERTLRNRWKQFVAGIQEVTFPLIKPV